MADRYAPLTVRGSEILGHRIRPEQDYRVILYDFKRPDKFSAEQLRTLHFVHEKIGRLFGPVLSAIVGQSTTVSCSAVDQLTFAEFMESAPEASAYVPMTVRALSGQMLVQIDGSLAQALIHAACGAKPVGEIGHPARHFTEFECLVLRDVVEKITPQIDEAWRPVTETGMEIVDIETDPEMVRIVPPSEMIVLGSMEVSLPGGSGFINFAIPYITIEPILKRLTMQWWFGKVRSGARRVGPGSATLPAAVELFALTAGLRLSELKAVAGGTPLELPSLSRGELLVNAGGVTVAKVHADPIIPVDSVPISVRVTEHRALVRRLAEANEHSAGSPAGEAIRELSAEVRNVRQAVLEMRDDRETMLAELAGSDLDGKNTMQDQDIIRKQHHAVAVMLSGEDPAIVAFLIAGLSPEAAAALLSDLEPDLQPEVVKRLVELKDADKALHSRLLSFVGRRIARSLSAATAGGPEVAATILINTPRSVEKNVMETFQRDNMTLFEELARRMFVFEDFVLVDATAIRKLAERVSAEEFALALKGMPEEVTTHIQGAFTPEFSDSVVSAVERLGPVRRRDVEAAQRDIIEELRQLESSGDVVIARPDEVIE